MKIAQIVCTWPPYTGGIGNSAYTIEQLLKDKNQIQSFTPYNTKTWLKYGHGAVLFSLLWKLKKFDYIYLHYPFFGTAEIVWLFKLLHPQKKLIIHYHMDVVNYSLVTKILSWPNKLIQTSLFNKAETIISASLDYVENSSIKNIYKKNKDKFIEIPFGIDPNLYKPRLIKEESDNKIIRKAKEIIDHINHKYLKRNKIEILFIGGLDKAHYFKGIEVLLQSLFLLPKNNWHLTVVGDGDLKEKYIKLGEKLNISHKISFVGKIKEEKKLIRTIQNHDLLILPSINKNEAFGLVLIEAMSCGLPVIASDLPGVRKVFNNYQQGLIVEPNNIEDLKEKIEFFLNNEKKREEMGKEARILINKKYSLEKMKENLEKVFI